MTQGLKGSFDKESACSKPVHTIRRRCADLKYPTVPTLSQLAGFRGFRTFLRTRPKRINATHWIAALGLMLAAQSSPASNPKEVSDQVKGLLEHMVQALRTLDYTGTLVYLHEHQLESMRITHVVRDGQELERLVSLNGSAREVKRDQSSITCVMPDAKAISVDQRAPGAGLIPSLGDLDRLDGLYGLHPLGDYRVAGRSASVIGVIPKDDFRYGYRFYLDGETGLPLKTDLMNERAKPLEQIMFTSLTLNSATMPGDGTPRQQEGFRRLVREAPQAITIEHPGQWDFADLPVGFRLHMHNHRTADDGRMVEHLVLSDGLASISVYIEQGGGEGLQGAAHVGAVNAWGGRVEGHWVTAVGEVPSITVRRIVESMRHIPDRDAR